MTRHMVMLGFLLLAACGVPDSAKCSRACQPVGFDTTHGGCVCLDGGWSECACAMRPEECAASGGPAPKEWRLW